MKFKINKTNNYTVMSNYHLRDKKLSLKSKGLLSTMFSLPDNWDYSISGLVSILKENETSISSALRELKERGYLRIIKKLPNKTKTGRIEYEYNIYEMPKQDIGKQEVEKQDLENLGLEFQGLENQGQLNTNKLNIKELNTNNNTYKENFEKFWKAYPKKRDKGKAVKWFEKNKPSKELVEKMIKQIERFKDTKEWKKENGQFIPYPTTWLNAMAWEDEFETDTEREQRIEKEIEQGYYGY